MKVIKENDFENEVGKDMIESYEKEFNKKIKSSKTIITYVI